MEPADGPAHWEADVVLRDGRPCHVRPISPDDATRLRTFHRALSPETVYLRYFAPYPELTEADVTRFTTVDHDSRVALVATVGSDIIGVARYDRLASGDAEVAFTIRDDHQGRGLGSVLLEHLAAAARERGVSRFVADVLHENRRMQATFEDAGYRTLREMGDGYLMLEFDIEPTARLQQVMEARERASEARSIRRLLSPGSVAVIGASRTPGTAGHELLRNLRDGGFTGHVFAIHPEADQILGYPCLRSISQAPAGIDLAIVAVRADLVLSIVDECASAAVRGLVVVSMGFAESGSDEGRRRQAELVARARGNGMRVVGPAALGVISTDPRVLLNASLAPVMPPRGRLGFFCQSGGLGSVILESLVDRGLGVSSFVSAGNRSDVSGNDLLQFWAEDDATDAVLLYLESIGNPRKFTRVVRRLARSKPVVAVRSGRSSQAVPLGHRVRLTSLPPAAVDAIFEQCGVIQTDSVRALLDVASILARQPLPAGPAVSVIATAEALAVLADDAVRAAGLRVGGAGAVVPLPLDAEALEAAVRRAGIDPDTDTILVVHVPPLPGDVPAFRDALLNAGASLTRPLIAVSVSSAGEELENRRLEHARYGPWIGAPAPSGAAGPGAIPLFGTLEDATRAIASVAARSRWLERELADSDAVAAALGEGESVLSMEHAEFRAADLMSGYPLGRLVTVDEARPLLECFGVTTDPTSRRDLPGAVACRVRVLVDDLFGPVVVFGLDGDIPELLGDRAYASPPITAATADFLIRTPASAVLLEGHLGSAPIDHEALVRVVVGVGALAEHLPALASADLLVIAHPAGAHVVEGAISLLPLAAVPIDGDRRVM